MCVNSGSWVKAWASWFSVQQDFVAVKGHAPQNLQESWDWLNTRNGPLLNGDPRMKRLDRMLKAINDDGRPVILTVFESSPTWATTDTTTDPAGRGIQYHVPDDVTSASPWGWFISHLIARYKKGVPVNPEGPHQPGASEPFTAWMGNSAGAVIDFLEIVNEPNTEMWPQGTGGGGWMECKVADMMKSAEEWAYFWSWHLTNQGLLAPATNDKYSPFGPDPVPEEQRGYNNTLTWYTDFDRFTVGVLGQLQNWNPRVPVGWSQHNYLDIQEWTSLQNADGVTFPSRVAMTHDRLIHSNWKGSTIDGRVWLTEGGYNKRHDSSLGPTQDSLCRQNFSYMKGSAYPYVPIWTFYGIIDVPPNAATYGMRDASVGPDGVTLGTQYPIQSDWVNHMPPP